MAPQLIERPGHLECPECGALDSINLIDTAVRTNRTEIENNTDEAGTGQVFYLHVVPGEFQFDTTLFECSACYIEVALPSNVEEHWG